MTQEEISYPEYSLNELDELRLKEHNVEKGIFEAHSQLKKTIELMEEILKHLPANERERLWNINENLKREKASLGTEFSKHAKEYKKLDDAVKYRRSHLSTNLSPYFTTYEHRCAESTRDTLKVIFKELRKEGFIAKMNTEDYLFMQAKEKFEKTGKLTKGLIYWDRQDERTLRVYSSYTHRWKQYKEEHWNSLGVLYISWDKVEINGQSALTKEEVAKRFIELLNKYEVPFTWDGSEWTCFGIVFGDDAIKVEKTINDYYTDLKKKNKKKD